MKPAQRVDVDAHKTSPKSKSGGVTGMMGGVGSPIDMISRQLGSNRGGETNAHLAAVVVIALILAMGLPLMPAIQ